MIRRLPTFPLVLQRLPTRLPRKSLVLQRLPKRDPMTLMVWSAHLFHRTAFRVVSWTEASWPMLEHRLLRKCVLSGAASSIVYGSTRSCVRCRQHGNKLTSDFVIHRPLSPSCKVDTDEVFFCSLPTCLPIRSTLSWGSGGN